MGTVKDKLALLLGTKGSIREAISAMGQSVSDSDTFASYAAKIRAISSDATAAAGDILSGKTAYAGGKKITGSIARKGAGDLTASGATVSVPAGYYPSAVSKSVAAATQATPGISVSSGGLITASATQGAGYVAAGTKSATKQLTTQGAATITPGTAAKTAVAAGRYTTGAVTVAGDANLVAENIKSGVSIFGIAGEYNPHPKVLSFDKNSILFDESSERLYFNTGLTISNVAKEIVSISALIGITTGSGYFMATIMGPYGEPRTPSVIPGYYFTPSTSGTIDIYLDPTTGQLCCRSNWIGTDIKSIHTAGLHIGYLPTE